MHHSDDTNITHIPHNFKVACTLFNLSIQRFLQLFIDHVSFYDMLFQTEVDAYELATRTVSKYSFEKEELVKDDKHSVNLISTTDLEKSVEAIQTMRMIYAKNDLNDRQKREIAKQEVQKLFFHLGTSSIKSQKLYLNEKEILTLSPDFCLICEVQQISPIEHLSNLMENISLADMEARSSLNMRIENPSIAFYLRIRNTHGNLYENKATRTVLLDYLDELEKLRLYLFIYRSLAYRTEKHQELLNKYYNRLA